MKPQRWLTLPRVFLLIVGFAARVDAAPVLVNGSLDGIVGVNAAATGWSVASGTPDIVDADGPFNNTGVPWALSPDGGTFGRSIGTGNEHQEAFQQTVSGFSPGQLYTLNFFQTNLGFLVEGSSTWRDHPGYWSLFLDDALVGESAVVDAPAGPGDLIEWVAGSLTFQATGTTHTLRLEAFRTTPAILSAYLGIDGLELVAAVPVPATGWLLVSGLGLLGWRMRGGRLSLGMS